MYIPARDCGVYKITHLPTGKSYVGQSKNIEARLAGHIKDLTLGRHRISALQDLWNRSSDGEFDFSVVEVCPQKDLLVKEREWIARLNPDFNCKLWGNARKGPRSKMSDDARARISLGLKGNQNLLGHRHSEESRRKMSEARKKNHTKSKIGEAGDK